MIIDDNAGDCVLLREALREAAWDADIVEALSHQEALHVLERQTQLQVDPDILLLDYWLHREEAPAILEDIRSMSADTHLPVIVQSSSSLRLEQHDRCRRLGVLKILVRSHRFAGILALVRILRKILEGHRERSRGEAWISE
jgi:CheY-like chemotaxis protein